MLARGGFPLRVRQKALRQLSDLLADGKDDFMERIASFIMLTNLMEASQSENPSNESLSPSSSSTPSDS